MSAARTSPNERLEWTHEEACAKLIKAFNLGEKIQQEKKADIVGSSRIEEAAKAAIKVTSGGNALEPIQRHHYDAALRNFASSQEDVAGLIRDHVLERVLLRFYMEVVGIDVDTITTTLPETATAIQYLQYLLKRQLFAYRELTRVLFFFVVESCIPAIDELMFKQDHDLSKAIRSGLHTLILSRSKVNIAEFCLLTGEGPIKARRYKADTDLAGAVEFILTKMDDVTLLQRTVKCIKAKLFPFLSSEEVIQSVIEPQPVSREYAEVQKDYLVDFFRKEMLCNSDEQATAYLGANDWLMEHATREYRKMALTPGPSFDASLLHIAGLPHVEPNNSSVPSDDQDVTPIQLAVLTLVRKYQSSFPSYSVKDHLLIDMLRRYESGDFNTEAQIAIIHAQLTYRLRVCDLAMQIVQKLELRKGAAVRISDWNALVPEGADHKARTLIVGQLQRNTGWFRPKKNGDGQYYKKPLLYVARALDMQGYHGEQVMEQIEKAKEMLGETFEPEIMVQ